jgi:hypothetical protein
MIPDRFYSEILGDLQELESYLMTLGVQSPDRLQGIISNIKEIDLACSKGCGAALALQSGVTETHFRELVWSLKARNGPRFFEGSGTMNRQS